MTKTPRTVHAVIIRILGPVRVASAAGSSAADLFDSLPGFAGSGGVCGVAVSAFEKPGSVVFVDDGETFGVVSGGARLSGPSVPLSGLFELAFASLPERPPAPGSGLCVDVDERGVIEPEQECLVLDLADALSRPRLGTVLVDVVRDHGGRPHRPCDVLAFVDDDRGRHLAVRQWRPGGRRRLWWVPGTIDALAGFVEGRVPERVRTVRRPFAE